MDWGVKHRMPTAKQSDSGGGGVVFEISCTSVTAGTNTVSPAAMDIARPFVAVALWTTRRTAAEATRNVIAAIDNHLPVFIETSYENSTMGRLSAAIVHPRVLDGRGIAAC